MLCFDHQTDNQASGNITGDARYVATVRVDQLPRTNHQNRRFTIDRGFAVTGSFGGWFFKDLEAAIAFGRAVRESWDCTGYGVWRAARKTEGICAKHKVEEFVLLIQESAKRLDRQDDDVELLTRFVQGIAKRSRRAGGPATPAQSPGWTRSWNPPIITPRS